MKKNVVMLLSASILLFGCNQSEDTINNEVLEEEVLEISDDYHTDEDEDDMTINLNDGEKWTVNEEMEPYVEEGMDLVNAYINVEDEDYIGLADELTRVNSSLIKSCTMEGESHDELHKWLHPHLELVKALGAAENIEEANRLVNEISDSYTTFYRYFQ